MDLNVCRESHDGFQSRPGIKSLQPSHSQLTSILCPMVSFKPLEPREPGTAHWDPWIIWMEWLSSSDTVGNEDEIGCTCLKLMGMDCVRGDVEPHLLVARTWTVSLVNYSSTGRLMRALPKGCYTCDRPELARKVRTRFNGREVAVIRLDHAAAHPLFLVPLLLIWNC